MTRRNWLRHPARTLHQPATCPTGEQRYRTAATIPPNTRR